MLVDLKPSGEHYMEHFHWAGGVPRLLQRARDLLDLDALDRHRRGRCGERCRRRRRRRAGQDVIRPRDDPIQRERRHGACCAAIWRRAAR